MWKVDSTNETEAIGKYGVWDFEVNEIVFQISIFFRQYLQKIGNLKLHYNLNISLFMFLVICINMCHLIVRDLSHFWKLYLRFHQT